MVLNEEVHPVHVLQLEAPARKATNQSCKPQRVATARNRFIPQVEVLETRLAPAQLVSLATFTGNSGAALGQTPGALLSDAAGDLFGTTNTGGASNDGTVFELQKNGSFETLVSFTGTSGTALGQNPDPTLLSDAAGDLFGMTSAGGSNSDGTVFELQNNSGIYTFKTLVNFTGTSGLYLGSYPNGGLIKDAAGDLFGTTRMGGGTANEGTVFELQNNSGTYTSFKNLVSFTGTSGAAVGALPVEGLYIDGTGDLFGTTASGGNAGTGPFSGGYGTVFELQDNMGNYTFKNLASFTGTSGLYLGAQPFTSLTADGTGDLFGITDYGGSTSYPGAGTVFELQNTSGSYSFKNLVNFNGTNGLNPIPPLIADTAGDLFGVCGGGASNDGTVFELQNNSGSYTFKNLVSFTGTSGAAPGQTTTAASAALLADSAGDIFGVTSSGGTSSDGTVFELQNNSGSYTYLNLVNFTGTSGATPGQTPSAALLLDTAGDLLGTTSSGGTSNDGTVFDIPATVNLTPVGGNNQVGTVGSLLANPLVVQFTDALGRPLPNITVNWAAIGGGAVSYPPTSVTGANGDATMTGFLGTTAGQSNNLYYATVAAFSSTAIFTASATAGAAKNLLYVNGNNQYGSAGSHLPAPLVVEATDQFGNPVSGVTVNWAASGGSVPTSSSTGTNGQASVNAVLGTGTSTYTATSGTLSGSPITFTEYGNVASSTTTTLSGPSLVVSGQLAVFTTTVVGPAPTPTGLVTLYDGSNIIASGSLSSASSTTTSGFSFPSATSFTVNSTAGFASSGQLAVQTAGGLYTVATYTGISSNTFTGVSDSSAVTVNSNAAVLQGTATFLTSTLTLGSHTLTAVYNGDSAHAASTSSGLAVSVVAPNFSDTFNNGNFNGTTIAVGSDGVSLPTSTLYVTSTAGFAPTGQLAVQTTAGYVLLNYTGLTSTSFTNVSGGAGLGAVLHTGYTVQPTLSANWTTAPNPSSDTHPGVFAISTNQAVAEGPQHSSAVVNGFTPADVSVGALVNLSAATVATNISAGVLARRDSNNNAYVGELISDGTNMGVALGIAQGFGGFTQLPGTNFVLLGAGTSAWCVWMFRGRPLSCISTASWRSVPRMQRCRRRVVSGSTVRKRGPSSRVSALTSYCRRRRLSPTTSGGPMRRRWVIRGRWTRVPSRFRPMRQWPAPRSNRRPRSTVRASRR